MGSQFPLFLLSSSGNMTWLESRSKLSAVMSSNRINIALASGSTSTSETIFPRTSGKRVNLERGLGLRVLLLAAMIRLSQEGDLWSGLRPCLLHGAARFLSFIRAKNRRKQ